MGRLHGRIALVTGASSGIGAAVASALASEGAAVIGCARRFAAGAPRVVAGEVTHAQLDVTDEGAVERLFAEVGAVDILCCAAGVGIFAPLVDAKVADLRAMLEVHVVGGFLCARELLRQTRPDHPRSIVLTSSSAALRTFPDCGGYSAAKEGLRGLARVLAEEARAHDVRVTALYPGAVDTPIWDARPGFDRRKMMQPASLAGLVVEIVARPELAVDEIVVMPPAGAL